MNTGKQEPPAPSANTPLVPKPAELSKQMKETIAEWSRGMRSQHSTPDPEQTGNTSPLNRLTTGSQAGGSGSSSPILRSSPPRQQSPLGTPGIGSGGSLFVARSPLGGRSLSEAPNLGGINELPSLASDMAATLAGPVGDALRTPTPSPASVVDDNASWTRVGRRPVGPPTGEVRGSGTWKPRGRSGGKNRYFWHNNDGRKKGD